MSETPSWGKTIGAYFLCLLVMGFTSGFVSLGLALALQQGGYGVGGLISWLCAFGCASYYRSTGKLGTAVGIAFGIGIVLGVVVFMIAPLQQQLVQTRYGG